MSTPKQEVKYFERLNIQSLSINQIKTLIKNNIKNTIECWSNGRDIDRQTFHVVGPAGVGKTAICYQICEELTTELSKKFEIIKITSPVLCRDDFILPFPIIDNGNDSFKMLYSDFVPKDKDSYGLFVIDEFSRGDHTLQQLLWQIQNEQRLHTMNFPKGWFVVSIDNPDDQEYSMDYLQDAAGLRRMLHLYTEVNAVEFIKYGITKNYHPAVIEFIQIHADYLYDFKSQSIGAVYANPASWERVSNILHGYGDSIKSNYEEIEILASGLLNTSMSRLFVNFLRDRKDISPADIFFNYNKVRKEIDKLINERDNAKLGEIMTSFTTYLTTTCPTYDNSQLKNVVEFLTKMPIDTSALFITLLGKMTKSSKEFRYVNTMHCTLMKNDVYKREFYEKLKTIEPK